METGRRLWSFFEIKFANMFTHPALQTCVWVLGPPPKIFKLLSLALVVTPRRPLTVREHSLSDCVCSESQIKPSWKVRCIPDITFQINVYVSTLHSCSISILNCERLCGCLEKLFMCRFSFQLQMT